VKKRFATVFGLCGYMIGLLYYVHADFLNSDALETLLWYSCVGCIRLGTPYTDRWKVGVFITGPLNGLIYAIVGVLIAAAILRFRRARRG